MDGVEQWLGAGSDSVVGEVNVDTVLWWVREVDGVVLWREADGKWFCGE